MSNLSSYAHYVIRVLLHEWNVFPLKIQKSTVKKLHSHSVQKELGNAGEAQQSFQLLRWYAAQWNTGWNHLPRNLGKLYSDYSDGDEYINLPNFTSLVFVEEFGPLWVLALTLFVLLRGYQPIFWYPKSVAPIGTDHWWDGSCTLSLQREIQRCLGKNLAAMLASRCHGHIKTEIWISLQTKE